MLKRETLDLSYKNKNTSIKREQFDFSLST